MGAGERIGDRLADARNRLTDFSDTPGLDAQLLMAHAVGKPKTWILTHPETELSQHSNAIFEQLLADRISGTPLPYLLGRWEFYGRSFLVTPGVLIPRPETELLVEQASAWARQRNAAVRIADVGTGSGCIAISIALECPGAMVVGLDVSPDALDAAKENCRRLEGGPIRWIESDLLTGLPDELRPIDLVCANLPYIPTATWQDLDVSKHEPRLALDGGVDGLRVIERLLAQLPAVLSEEALVLVEIESTTGEAAAQLSRNYFPGAEVKILADYSDLPRIVRIELQKKPEAQPGVSG